MSPHTPDTHGHSSSAGGSAASQAVAQLHSFRSSADGGTGTRYTHSRLCRPVCMMPASRRRAGASALGPTTRLSARPSAAPQYIKQQAAARSWVCCRPVMLSFAGDRGKGLNAVARLAPGVQSAPSPLPGHDRRQQWLVADAWLAAIHSTVSPPVVCSAGCGAGLCNSHGRAQLWTTLTRRCCLSRAVERVLLLHHVWRRASVTAAARPFEGGACTIAPVLLAASQCCVWTTRSWRPASPAQPLGHGGRRCCFPRHRR